MTKFKNWIQTRLTWLNGHMLGKSNITSADRFETAFNYRTFPNPAQDKVFIESSSEINNIKFYNNSGTCIVNKERVSAFSTRIDVSGFASGVYLIRLITNGNKAVSSKLIIQ